MTDQSQLDEMLRLIRQAVHRGAMEALQQQPGGWPTVDEVLEEMEELARRELPD